MKTRKYDLNSIPYAGRPFYTPVGQHSEEDGADMTDDQPSSHADSGCRWQIKCVCAAAFVLVTTVVAVITCTHILKPHHEIIKTTYDMVRNNRAAIVNDVSTAFQRISPKLSTKKGQYRIDHNGINYGTHTNNNTNNNTDDKTDDKTDSKTNNKTDNTTKASNPPRLKH